MALRKEAPHTMYPLCIHSAKFGGHSHGSSGHITYLICHVTLQDHVIQRSCKVMEAPTYM